MGDAKVGKLEALRARHRREVRALVREALGRFDWYASHEAAEYLGIVKSSLQVIVNGDSELREEWQRHVMARRGSRVKELSARARAAERRLDAARRGLGA